MKFGINFRHQETKGKLKTYKVHMFLASPLTLYFCNLTPTNMVHALSDLAQTLNITLDIGL